MAEELRSIMRLHLPGSLAVAVGLVMLPAFFAAESSVTVSLDAAHAGPEIGSEFSGLSYEAAAVLPDGKGVRYFRPDNAALVQLFRTLGIKSLRIGGNTSDWNATRLPSAADWDSLFAFARAAGVRVLYCLRLYDGDAHVAAATASYILARYAPQVDSFSIGQEPSAYPTTAVDSRPPGQRMGGAAEKYPYAAYHDRWQAFAATIIAAVPEVKFCGPSIHNNGEWGRRFIADFGRGHHVVLITEHLYPGGAAGLLPSPEVGRDRMLSEEFVRANEKLYAGFVPQAKAVGLPYRLEEVNNYFNGGASGASDTFAATLWGLDFMYWWATHGAAGLNFHTGNQVAVNQTVRVPRYNAFASIPGGFEIRPLAYGIKAFDIGGHGRVISLRVENADQLNLTAYGVLAADRSVFVTLINKEHGPRARAAVVTFAGGATAGAMDAMFLKAPDGNVAAKSRLTLGDAAINEDGTWAGRWVSVSSPTESGARPPRITVPAASAVIIKLAR